MTNKDSSQLENYNARRFVWSNGLQNIGDQVLSPKSVLPWIMHGMGVPNFFTALLTPIRESGSMLPQAAITPWVLSQKSRKRVWIIGSLGQAVSAALIGVAALFTEGWVFGLLTILFLATLALSRSLCSISSKDVQGRTISKGHRGRVTGRATVIGGAVALIAGAGLSMVPDDATEILIALIFGSAACWFFATLVFRTIKEPDYEDAPEEPKSPIDWGFLRTCWDLFSGDKLFRNFVIVRTLLLVTALSTTFIVVLAREAGASLSGIGAFLAASGLASLVGGRVSGWLSDISSRNVMAAGSAFASIVLLALVASAAWATHDINVWAMPIGFFLVNLAHTAIRVARKTYVVDMAEGDNRTTYVSSANTIMGIMLLLVGGVSAVISLAGAAASLIFFAVLGLLGTLLASRMKDVS
ncbi:MFS transporter [Corynebacterium renale]|uniref:MFS transporter n=1 Tax=Corynebacterium renale TaxID=1724 RepID=UPI000652CC39|nr:MFS transporter [Corynebacterium renale]